MKRIVVLCAALFALTPVVQSASYINAGNRFSGFKINNNGGDGVLKVKSNGALNANEMTIITDTISGLNLSEKSITMDRSTLIVSDDSSENASHELFMAGTLAASGAITLANTDRLVLKGGTTSGAVTVTGANATIEGFGLLGGAIDIQTSKTLSVNMPSLNVGFGTSAGTLKLLADLDLSQGVTQLPAFVDGNGYQLALGGASSTTLANSTTWTNGDVELKGAVVIAAGATHTVVNSSTLRINGNGNLLSFANSVANITVGTDAAASLALTDVVLPELLATNLVVSHADGRLYLMDVTFLDSASNEVMTVHAAGSTAHAAAALAPTTAGNMGTLFDTNLNWANGAIIDMHKASALGNSGATATWTLGADTAINCNGNTLDLTYGIFSLASDTTLTISDAIITGFRNAAFAFASNTTSSVVFNNCTIVIPSSGDVTLAGVSGSPKSMTFRGTTMVITGAKSLLVGDYATLVIDGVTYYDTLGTSDIENIRKTGTTSSYLSVTSTTSRLAAMLTRESRNVNVGGNITLADSKFLFPDVGTIGEAGYVNGSQLIVTATATIDGAGRAFIFADTTSTALADSRTMVNVADSATATFKNIVLDGLENGCMNLNSTGAMKFDNGTVIKLRHNDALTRTYTFGGTENASMVLDLNGYDLDMSNASAKILLDAGFPGTTLTIMNGRIINLSNDGAGTPVGKIDTVLDNSSKKNKVNIILQDVDLVLSGNLTTTGVAFTVKGNCSVSAAGTAYYTWTNSAATDYAATPLAINFKIETGSRFTVTNGMTYSHTGGNGNFKFANRTSELNLVGGAFSTNQTNLVLEGGSLFADHASSLSGNITLGHPTDTNSRLYMNLMPGTLLNLTGGTIIYANDDSAL